MRVHVRPAAGVQADLDDAVLAPHLEEVGVLPGVLLERGRGKVPLPALGEIDRHRTSMS
ncbi:hypothetical protein [Actinomadura madurae]|uniref:hypothetical protein n=1 Tax=Actinomadura madurae TaxID=1993 RepID=UPI0020D23ECD|nr:hypothetical protein [Actinomadura madurae]MCQ0016540.1 hypothetical protein [Actinomadura madurae]